ncbi:GNAT family N-acetyltransferase [Frankia sp. CNm7]|uniref:GNAT family N-acetyltransferase n=1 Tax=Frankia nepalensis TaxID=1836974 RepID=A0A937UNX8_9ACTN|nr:GNAT family N-acetyltransferase [Frankia nepalensis]MBL7500605.1 GNAT family N-acetyltransferase [Frankia nepalensis]MBL7510994.1 GNAT family N-acetyltransferase [Frankia nepalensis]MBL7518493.1 GNAT family N-acetyltransferase [Frankia nepalensis]MBL7630299.1 GNAT family N-acetyltransferase [Frankia nepalensis]
MSPRPAAAPARLAEEHDTRGFRSGDDRLDGWLRHRALEQHEEGVTTFVLSDGGRVVGYYCLTRGAVEHTRAAPPRWRARRAALAPSDPIPALLVGRLAVDETVQGAGVGARLLRDAVMRAATVYRTAGLPLLLAHAPSPAARGFYRHFGFTSTRLDPYLVALALRHATAGPGPGPGG